MAEMRKPYLAKTPIVEKINRPLTNYGQPVAPKKEPPPKTSTTFTPRTPLVGNRTASPVASARRTGTAPPARSGLAFSKRSPLVVSRSPISRTKSEAIPATKGSSPYSRKSPLQIEQRGNLHSRFGSSITPLRGSNNTTASDMIRYMASIIGTNEDTDNRRSAGERPYPQAVPTPYFYG